MIKDQKKVYLAENFLFLELPWNFPKFSQPNVKALSTIKKQRLSCFHLFLARFFSLQQFPVRILLVLFPLADIHMGIKKR